MVVLQGVSKRMGYRFVLADVSLSLDAGEVLAVTGPNGAGKTTLLRIMAGLVPATKGTLNVPQGQDVGYIGHRPMVYSSLTVEENLAFFAKLYRRSRDGDVPGILKELGLSRFRRMLASQLSRGLQQRLSLGRLLLFAPRLVLFDEPFAGLDEAGQEYLRSLLVRLRQRAAVQIVVSHNLHEIHGIASRHVILSQGRCQEDAAFCTQHTAHC